MTDCKRGGPQKAIVISQLVELVLFDNYLRSFLGAIVLVVMCAFVCRVAYRRA